MLRPSRAALCALVLAISPVVAQAQQAAPQLSLEHRMLLRCSAAMALVANRQAGGDPVALRYPPVQESGREFFVRASAQVMAEAGLDRAQIEAALTAEAQDIVASGTLEQIVPVCLDLLPAQ